MPADVHFHWNKRSLNVTALSMLAIALIGAVLLAQEELAVKIFGAGWTAIFVAIALYARRRCADVGPVVTVSADGVRDTRLADAALPWNAISQLEGLEVESVSFVGVNFYDTRSALANARPTVRRMAPVHRLLGFPAVSISMTLLDGSDADLVAAIASFRPDLAPTN